MADKAPKSAAQPGFKFPPNWSKMTKQQRLKWQEENRPGFTVAARAARAPVAPAPAPTPVTEEEPGNEWDEQAQNGEQEQEQEQPVEQEHDTVNVELKLPPQNPDERIKSPREVVADLLHKIADGLVPRQ